MNDMQITKLATDEPTIYWEKIKLTGFEQLLDAIQADSNNHEVMINNLSNVYFTYQNQLTYLHWNFATKENISKKEKANFEYREKIIKNQSNYIYRFYRQAYMKWIKSFDLKK